MEQSVEFARSHSKREWKSWVLLGAGVLTVAALAAGIIIILLHRQPVATNPFDANTKSAVSFPLYYPTHLPAGYQTDKKSINLPQSGIVVYTIEGPNGAKIYLSQQARPSTFDFGGYYRNFADLQQTVTSNGTIAVGHISDKQTAVGSMVIGGKTWVLINTGAKNLPLSDLHDILASLTISH